jgi:hypothetical protein
MSIVIRAEGVRVAFNHEHRASGQHRAIGFGYYIIRAAKLKTD